MAESNQEYALRIRLEKAEKQIAKLAEGLKEVTQACKNATLRFRELEKALDRVASSSSGHHDHPRLVW